MSPTAAAFMLAVAAASATMIGWAIAASRKQWSPRVFGVILLLAAIAMLAISGRELLPSALGQGLSLPQVIGWAAAGAAFVVVMHVLADRMGVGDSRLGRSALLVAVAIGVHNIPEGAAPLAVGLLSLREGAITALAVGLHNIPEGVAVSAPVLAAGGSRRKAFWYTALATGGEILGAVIALLFAEALSPTRIAGLLAVVAGIMITLSLVELLPSAVRLLRQPATPAAAYTGPAPGERGA